MPQPARPGLEPRTSDLDFAHEVAQDLTRTPKQLQARYLYDELGSSLFEAICRLPWYRITRAERRILAAHAADLLRVLSRGTGVPAPTFVELGCGSGEKLVILIDALHATGGGGRVHLVDISAQALQHSVRTLSRYARVTVVAHQGTYEAGLGKATASREAGGPLVILFLGSNIGNFDTQAAQAFLSAIRATLEPGDFLLLGADLVKPERDLLLAYDDPLQVTAAFNRNLLVRINRELGADFNLDAFAHRALWNAEEGRVEMHLESLTDQCVSIPGARSRVRFACGERIWTESSYKYDLPQLARMGRAAGFSIRAQWVDDEARFALTLFTAA